MGGGVGTVTKEELQEVVTKVDLATLKGFAPFFVINAYIGRGVQEKFDQYDEQGRALLLRAKRKDFDALARGGDDELIKLIAKSALLAILRDTVELALLHPEPAENIRSFQVMAYTLLMFHDEDKLTPEQARLRKQGHVDMDRDFRKNKEQGKEPLTEPQAFSLIDKTLKGLEVNFDECFPAAAVAAELARKWGISDAGFEEKLQRFFHEAMTENMQTMQAVVASVRKKFSDQELSAVVAAFQKSAQEKAVSSPSPLVSFVSRLRPGGIK